MSRAMFDRQKFAADLAWAASAENPDADVRAMTRELLDTLCYLNAIVPYGLKPKSQLLEKTKK